MTTQKETAYDASISPLMAQIIDICKANKINMAATFSLDADPDHDDEPLFCTTVIEIDGTDVEGAKRIADCRAVMDPPEPKLFAFTITTKSATS